MSSLRSDSPIATMLRRKVSGSKRGGGGFRHHSTRSLALSNRSPSMASLPSIHHVFCLTDTEQAAVRQCFYKMGGILRSETEKVRLMMTRLGVDTNVGGLFDHLPEILHRDSIVGTVGERLDAHNCLLLFDFFKRVHLKTNSDPNKDLLEAYVAAGGNSDGSGAVDAAILTDRFQQLQLSSDIGELLQSIDADGSGQVEYDEFVTLLTSLGGEGGIEATSAFLRLGGDPESAHSTVRISEVLRQLPVLCSSARWRTALEQGLLERQEGKDTLNFEEFSALVDAVNLRVVDSPKVSFISRDASVCESPSTLTIQLPQVVQTDSHHSEASRLLKRLKCVNTSVKKMLRRRSEVSNSTPSDRDSAGLFLSSDATSLKCTFPEELHHLRSINPNSLHRCILRIRHGAHPIPRGGAAESDRASNYSSLPSTPQSVNLSTRHGDHPGAIGDLEGLTVLSSLTKQRFVKCLRIAFNLLRQHARICGRCSLLGETNGSDFRGQQHKAKKSTPQTYVAFPPLQSLKSEGLVETPLSARRIPKPPERRPTDSNDDIVLSPLKLKLAEAQLTKAREGATKAPKPEKDYVSLNEPTASTETPSRSSAIQKDKPAATPRSKRDVQPKLLSFDHTDARLHLIFRQSQQSGLQRSPRRV
jgi:hypothetical protein